MRPAQRAKKAEEAANKLSSLVCSPQVTQLLQQPLPPQPTAAQIAVLDSCSSSLFKLCNTLPDELPNTDAGRAAAVQLLRGVLRHHPVHSAGVPDGVAAAAAAATAGGNAAGVLWQRGAAQCDRRSLACRHASAVWAR